MALVEYDPTCSPSEYRIGESYIFIRRLNNAVVLTMDENAALAEGLTPKPEKSGVTPKTEESGVTPKNAITDNVDDEESGLVPKATVSKAAAASSDSLNVKVDFTDDNYALRYASFLKQVGKVVGKEPQKDGSTYLCVEFKGVKGVRKFKCPHNADMYYVIDKMINADGVAYQV